MEGGRADEEISTPSPCVVIAGITTRLPLGRLEAHVTGELALEVWERLLEVRGISNIISKASVAL